MSEAVQIAGALAILVAYALAQLEIVDQRAYPYILLNLAGAIVLGVIAWIEELWGFFLLEAAWGLIALAGLIERLRARTKA